MTAPVFAGRIGGASAVYPVIRVRFSGDTHRYNAVAHWDEYTARASAPESPNTRTASESAVLAAWSAHVKLAEKVHAPREGEDPSWWAERLAEKVDPSRYTVIVTDESDILPGGRGGGYLVTFADGVEVVR